jgi:hypothetical protein
MVLPRLSTLLLRLQDAVAVAVTGTLGLEVGAGWDSVGGAAVGGMPPSSVRFVDTATTATAMSTAIAPRASGSHSRGRCWCGASAWVRSVARASGVATGAPHRPQKVPTTG